MPLTPTDDNDRKKPGRRRLPEEARKTARVVVPMTRADLERFDRAASASQVPLTEWLRRAAASFLEHDASRVEVITRRAHEVVDGLSRSEREAWLRFLLIVTFAAKAGARSELHLREPWLSDPEPCGTVPFT
jgi:hypothetical protein